MARIPRHTIDEIRDRTDLIELVSRHVSLKRAGNGYKGPCPFHQEKSPSFNVVPHKGIYHCFGCGAGGDCFRFLMMIEGLSFIEAVKELAEAAGVVIEERELTADERRQLAKRATTYDVLEEAARFYESSLWTKAEGAPARAYLEKRALTQEAAQAARLGYAPDKWQGLLDHLHARGMPEELAVEAGLARPGKSGGHYDFLRDRLIFPIRDEKGRVIAFGGRIMQGDGPKYMNTPESPVYDKGKVLYGLERARAEIQKKNRTLLVEGYMDVLALHQAGYLEAVATCGTALTPSHMEKLRRLCDEVIALFDGDAAGIRAAERSLPLFLGARVSPFRLELPGAKDPDELIREQGVEAMERALEHKIPLLEWWLKRQRSEVGTGPGAQARLMDAVLPLLRDLDRTVLSQVAAILRINEGALLEQLSRAPGAPPDAGPAPASGWRPTKEMVHLIWLLVHRHGETADLVGQLDPTLIQGPPEVLGTLARLVAGEPVASIQSEVLDEGLARTLSAVVARDQLYTAEQAAGGACELLFKLGSNRRQQAMATADELADRARIDGDPEAQVSALRRKAEIFALDRSLERALKRNDSQEFAALMAKEMSVVGHRLQ